MSTSDADDVNGDGEVPNLGSRLRGARRDLGLSLRELARRVSVSPSLLSQIETGKSQPSVATLYALAQALDVSIDRLFDVRASAETRPSDTLIPEQHAHGAGPSDLSVTAPGKRTSLVMDSGVMWEQLATNTTHEVDFIEMTYPAGSSSTSDDRMLRHDGFEYGYLLEGQLEVTVGEQTFTLQAGHAVGLNSSVPHLFRNLQATAARGIWFMHHQGSSTQES